MTLRAVRATLGAESGWVVLAIGPEQTWDTAADAQIVGFVLRAGSRWSGTVGIGDSEVMLPPQATLRAACDYVALVRGADGCEIMPTKTTINLDALVERLRRARA